MSEDLDDNWQQIGAVARRLVDRLHSPPPEEAPVRKRAVTYPDPEYWGLGEKTAERTDP
jgi:hypothetical protein